MCFLKKKQTLIVPAERDISRLIIHCSATMPHMDIGVKEIRKWHKARGFNDIGYHYVRRRNGVLEIGRDIELVGAHVRGLNTGSIGYCLVGGVDEYNDPENNFTEPQWDGLIKDIETFRDYYPNIEITGHNEHAAKACPSFNVQDWLRLNHLI